MPDALELPRMLRSVVPLMGGQGLSGLGRGIIDELVAVAFGHSVRCGGRLTRRSSRLFPCFPAVIGPLDDLSEPAARLRGVDDIRLRGRSLHMIDLPSDEQRSADVPLLSCAIRRQDESPLASADQQSDMAHIR